MKSDTLILYNKYLYNLFIYSNERVFLFVKNKDELDHELFFEYYDNVINKHFHLKHHWKYFKKRRSEIIKKFEIGKVDILISPYFCTDIKTLILTFIF